MKKRNVITLGEICKTMSYGVNASANFNSKGVRLLRITDIQEYGVNWKSVPGCKISERDRKKKKLKENDILIARTGSVGLSYLVKNPPEAVYASYLIRIQVDESKVLPEYVSHYLYSESYLNQLLKGTHGAAVPNVNSETLTNINIPVPNIAEQKNICGRISSLLYQIKVIKQSLSKQVSESFLLANSFITQSLQNTRNEKIGSVLTEVKHGIGERWKDFRVLGATRNGLALAKEPPGKTPQRYKPVTPRTVFYNPMRIMIGSIALVDEDDESGITSPDYVVLKGKEGVVDSRWFYYWLRSPFGEACIQSLARGAVRERMLFNRLAEGEIELPDYKTQLKASQAIAEIKPMQNAIESQLKELELIPQKLLAKTFES